MSSFLSQTFYPFVRTAALGVAMIGAFAAIYLTRTIFALALFCVGLLVAALVFLTRALFRTFGLSTKGLRKDIFRSPYHTH